MTTQKQTSAVQAMHKTQPKPALVPEVGNGAAVAELPSGMSELAGAPSLQGQVGCLGDPRLRAVQRQMVAGQIGRMQGNGHLQQVVAFTKQTQASAPYQVKIANPTPSHRSQSSHSTVHSGALAERKEIAETHSNEELYTLWGPDDNGIAASTGTQPNGTGAPQSVQREHATVSNPATTKTLSSGPDVPAIQRLFGIDIEGGVRKKIADFAHNVPGYSLLTFILGKDPISDAEVPRNATNLVRAVLGLVIGGEQIFQNLQQSGALQEAFDWLNEQIGKLNLTWPAIKALFTRALKALSPADLPNPWGAFEKAKQIFLPVLMRLKNFALSVGKKILEFVFTGALKLAGPLAGPVLGIIKKAGTAFDSIVKDPIGFLGRLISGLKKGFMNFVAKLPSHLVTGLAGWLMGALGDLVLPKDIFSLPGIFNLVMQVLGIGWSFIRKKAVQLMGEPVVAKLESLFEPFKILLTEGVGGLWRYVKDQITNLKEIVMDQIMQTVVGQAVEAGIKWIIGLLNPAGAVVKAAMAIYKIVSFFIEKGRKVMALFEAVSDSILAIAQNNLAGAAQFIETALARTIPLAIGFLANLAGIGDLPQKVRAVIGKVRQWIDKAVDWLLAKAKVLGAKLLNKLGMDKPVDPAEAQKRLDRGMAAAQAALIRFKGKAVGRAILHPLLTVIKLRYRLTALNLLVEGKEYYIEAIVNPKKKERVLDVKVSDGTFQATIDFNCREDLDKKEFKYQIRMAKYQLNSMTCEQFMSQREAFFKRKEEAEKQGRSIKATGRDPAGKARMSYYRNRLKEFLKKQVQKKTPEISDTDAQIQAEKRYKELTKGKDLAHHLDENASGYSTRIIGWRNARVNRSIGPAWPTRVKELEAKILEEVKSAEERKNTRMNIKLTVNGEQV